MLDRILQYILIIARGMNQKDAELLSSTILNHYKWS
jgi:hypothetical protein